MGVGEGQILKALEVTVRSLLLTLSEMEPLRVLS